MLVVHSFGGQIEDPVDGFNHRCAYTTFFSMPILWIYLFRKSYRDEKDTSSYSETTFDLLMLHGGSVMISVHFTAIIRIQV